MERNSRKRIERNIGLDIVRVCAALFVISGHFCVLNTPFNGTKFDGGGIFAQGLFVTLFQCGVPLFILLSGFLQSNKKIERRYYKSCIKVILAYLFYSIITILFRKYYIGEDLSWSQWGAKILDYSAIPYAWYIEMWLGLFLLIPFLNKLYKALSSKKEKLILIGSLILMTSIPNLLNRYEFYIAPAYWQISYPLTFYFIVSYIREYKPQVDVIKSLAIIITICLINPLFTILIMPDQPMIHIIGNSYGIFGITVATLVFLLLYQQDFKATLLRKVVGFAAPLSLGVYLSCYMFDRVFYPYFIENYYQDQSQFGWYFFAIVPLVYISSLLLAWIQSLLFRLLRIS